MKAFVSLFVLPMFLIACSTETEQRPMQAKVKAAATKDSGATGGNDALPTSPLPSSPVVTNIPPAATPVGNSNPVGSPVVTPPSTPTKAIKELSVLVFSKTGGFRHGDSIDEGKKAIKALQTKFGFNAEYSEDAAVINTANLAKFNVVFFLNTTGEILDDSQKAALEAYVKGGGGWAGTHSAADTLYKWPFYQTLIGAWFTHHGGIVKTDVKVETKAHMSTAFLAETYSHADEWYNYKFSVRTVPGITVLMSLDETKYKGGDMGPDHPITWCHNVEKGRSWYTGFGHTKETFTNPTDLRIIFNGILWAAGIDTPYEAM